MSEYSFAAETSELHDGGKILVEVEDRILILYQIGEQYFCTDDVCTHDGGSLYDGELNGYEISCPRHGARFDIRDGQALCMPATQPTCSHEIMIDGDRIMVKLSN